MSRFFLDYSDENAILFTVKTNLTDPKRLIALKNAIILLGLADRGENGF